ncbi:serine/threonine-protein phosphatase BSL1 [Tanacetum coccineum]
MDSKPLLHPAPDYFPLEAKWDTDDDAPGPRCGHTLTAVAQTKSHGPRLILFGGATAIEGGASAGIRLAGVTNSLHSYDVLTKKWTRMTPAGDPPSPRAAHAAAAVGTMVVFQGGIGPAGHSTDDLYVLDLTNDKYKWHRITGLLKAAAAVGTMVVFQGGIGPAGHSTDDLYVLDLTNDKYKWHRVVVQGQGPGPRYGHVMDLVSQRYLVTFSGNDGKKVLSDVWALDTAQKPYVWLKLDTGGDKPSARMYATASARSDGMFLLCGGRDTSGVPLDDAYALLMHKNGQWEWTLAPGVSPSSRYQHAAVFVGARLHVTGGALRGGRVVDGEAAVAVLDTAAGVWLDRHGLVTSSHSSNEQTEDPSLELMCRCRHATSSVGSCVYVYGGLRGDLLLDDFVVAENSPFHSDANNTSEKGSNMNNSLGTHQFLLFGSILMMTDLKGPLSTAQDAQSHIATPTKSMVPNVNSTSGWGLLQRAVIHLACSNFILRARSRRKTLVVGKAVIHWIILKMSSRPRKWLPPWLTEVFSRRPMKWERFVMMSEQYLSRETTVLQLKAPIKVFGDLHGQFTDLMRLFDEYGFPSSAGDIT